MGLAGRTPADPHVDHERLAMRWHAALTEAHGNVDVIPPCADLDRYRLVVAPAPYLMSPMTHSRLRSCSGDLVLSAAGGAVDEHARVTPSSLDDQALQPTTAEVLLTTTTGAPAVIRNNRVTSSRRSASWSRSVARSPRHVPDRGPDRSTAASAPHCPGRSPATGPARVG